MRKKVLIFAPHQDDEILSCAGLIHSLIKSNADLYIVFATNGDFYGRESASIRLLESISALKELKISNDNIIVLGFADTGMEYNSSFLWRLYHLPENVILKSFVSDATYHPLGNLEYSMKKFGIHFPYTKNAFSTIIECLIQDITPNFIFTSSRLDAHGDHAALCMFVEEAINKLKVNLPIYQYIIHSGDDKKWPDRKSINFTKPGNVTEELWKKRIRLSINNSVKKKQLIQLFTSQLSPSGYLLSFAKDEEIFFKAEEVP